MEFIEGWFIETKNGETFRLLILNGHYAGLSVAMTLYSRPWYAIKTTGLVGTEKEIIDRINDENQVTMKIEFNDEKKPVSFQVIDKNGKLLFADKDIRFFGKRVYNQ